MQATWSEVDGVRTLSAAAGEIQGPLHGCLVFGTGRSGETLRTSGANHAVEHLVLHEIGERVDHVLNGEVGIVTTKFWAFGLDEQVVDFFSAVARNLRNLPVDRLTSEVQVLEIEGRRNAGATHVSVDLRERFGPHGAGIISWPEFGLGCFTADELVEWAQTRFTADNATLWLSGPVPTELDLSELPRGRAPEQPGLRSVQVPGRSFVPSESNRVSLSVLFRNRSGVSTMLQFAERRATERLRREGMSYAIGVAPVDVCRGHSLGVLEADGADEHPTEVADVLLEIAHDLAENGPQEQELARLHGLRAQVHEHPQYRMGSLGALAEALVVDGEQFVPDDIDGLFDAQTPDGLRAVWQEVMDDTVLVLGPESIRERLQAGWTVVQPWSSEQLGGQRFVAIPGRERGVLVVGDAGVTWALDAERYRTIWWSDVEACLTLDSGSRRLIGSAGVEIWITPWCWQGGEVLTELVDAAVDPARHIRVGEGSLVVEHEHLEGPSDIRWLATIVGARATWKTDERVSLVIDTDGLFVLHGSYRGRDNERHQREVRQADRDTLVRIDPRNRWIPQHDIARVHLKHRPWTRAGMMSWTLTIETVDGARERLFLAADEQVRLARDYLPKALGARFST
jgi:hypothetical protein